MRPVQHKTSNDVLHPPAGVEREACTPLYITRSHDNDFPTVTSFWQPTADELARLNAGQPVRFDCWGHTHPPIKIGVDGE